MNRENIPGSDLLELYNTYSHEIAKAKGRDRFWKLPFYGIGLVNIAIPLAGLAVGNQEFLRVYSSYIMLPGVLSTAAAAGVSVWGLRRQRLTHINEIALQIAEAEGRVAYEPETEARRAYQVLSSAGFLMQSGSADIARSTAPTPLFRGLSRQLEEAQAKLINTTEDLAFKQWEIFLSSERFVDRAMREEIKLSSLDLANIYWSQVANNTENPDGQRRYAYQMRNKIREHSTKKDF